MEAVRSLSRPLLLALADALVLSRYRPADGVPGLAGLIPESALELVAAELHAMTQSGLSGAHLASFLRTLAAERAEAQALSDRTELVWSGEEVAGQTRNTALIVRHLFEEARERVLIASYAFDHVGGAALFGALAARFDSEAGLQIRFFVNIDRKFGDRRASQEIVAAFVKDFRERVWPGRRQPAVYFDPRALVLGSERACLHAKCVVADGQAAFVTSANFTEAAHERNYEAGVLLRDRRVASALEQQFESLAATGRLERCA